MSFKFDQTPYKDYRNMPKGKKGVDQRVKGNAKVALRFAGHNAFSHDVL